MEGVDYLSICRISPLRYLIYIEGGPKCLSLENCMRRMMLPNQNQGIFSLCHPCFAQRKYTRGVFPRFQTPQMHTHAAFPHFVFVLTVKLCKNCANHKPHDLFMINILEKVL